VTRRAAVLLFVLFLSIAFVLTHLPGESLPDVDLKHWLPAADKFVHAGLYFCLAGLLANYLRFFIRSNRRIAIATMCLLSLYAAFDEWSQQFSPSRTPDFYDFVADVCGAFVGVSTFALWRWFRRSRHETGKPNTLAAKLAEDDPQGVVPAALDIAADDFSESTTGVSRSKQTADRPPTPSSASLRAGNVVR